MNILALSAAAEDHKIESADCIYLSTETEASAWALGNKCLPYLEEALASRNSDPYKTYLKAICQLHYMFLPTDP